MERYDFEASIGYWLTLTTQAYHRNLSEKLAPDGITHRQMEVIGWLKLLGELSPGELARRLMIEPPTMVRILDRMSAAGWLERAEDPLDGRRRIVRLNAAADPVWERITKRARELRQFAVTGLTSSEVDTLRNLLGRVCANLSDSETLAENNLECSPEYAGIR